MWQPLYLMAGAYQSNHHMICSGSEEGSYLRPLDFYMTQLQA